MPRCLMLTVFLLGMFLCGAGRAVAHCEVPCGIYADQRRFERMLEDQETISKALNNIQELTERIMDQPDPQSVNQLARWVTTKEDHATNTQHIIAQYFMTQRIKPGTDAAGNREYVKRLTAAHAVMVAAMKCKQTADPAAADKLKNTILDFYRGYEGKEPNFQKD